MPPRLKNQLFKVCLNEQTKQMAYFFSDKTNSYSAPVGLMRKIVCALHCTFWDAFAPIIEKNKAPDGVYFIFGGHCLLTSTYEIEGQDYGFQIKLPERSWFGDYQVLMNSTSTFNMIAGNCKNDTQNPLVKMMHIESSCFTGYVNEYPHFRRFLILRSSVRRAYLNYKMKMCSYEGYLKQALLEFEEEEPDCIRDEAFAIEAEATPGTKIYFAQQVVNKFIGELKKVGSQGDLDVMSLENRSYLLANGYLDIGNAKESSDKDVNNLVLKLNAEMIKVYAFNNINSQWISQYYGISSNTILLPTRKPENNLDYS